MIKYKISSVKSPKSGLKVISQVLCRWLTCRLTMW